MLVVVTPSDKTSLIKWGTIAASLLPLGISIYMLYAYDFSAGGMAFEVNIPWIESLNASIHMGVDGLSVPLVFLTALLSTLSIYYSAGVINTRVKEYFAMFLLLELSMLGVFVALDYVLFYVFWEISLVPMYLLIGIWGGKNRNYASIKFFIYTLVGSVAMLLAILGTYFATGTFDILESAAAAAVHGLPGGQGAALLQPGVLGFLPGLRVQGSELPVPHLVAGCAYGGADSGFGDSGRRAAEAGRVRIPAHSAAGISRRQPVLEHVDCGAGRHRHRIRRLCVCGADGP